MDMGKSKVCVFVLWRVLVCSLLASACVGCGEAIRGGVVSELHFELQPHVPPGSGNGHSVCCAVSNRFEGVREYFSDQVLHADLGEDLGRTPKDVGASLEVAAIEGVDLQFILRAKGENGDAAETLSRAAFARYEQYLIESQQRCREESIARLERQIEEQKIKVAMAKAQMDAAYEKLQTAEGEN